MCDKLYVLPVLPLKQVHKQPCEWAVSERMIGTEVLPGQSGVGSGNLT